MTQVARAPHGSHYLCPLGHGVTSLDSVCVCVCVCVCMCLSLPCPPAVPPIWHWNESLLPGMGSCRRSDSPSIGFLLSRRWNVSLILPVRRYLHAWGDELLHACRVCQLNHLPPEFFFFFVVFRDIA